MIARERNLKCHDTLMLISKNSQARGLCRFAVYQELDETGYIDNLYKR